VDLCDRPTRVQPFYPQTASARSPLCLCMFPLFTDEETSSVLVGLQLNHTPAYEEFLIVFQLTGETRRIVFMYQNLAFVALREGEAERARSLERQGLQLACAMNNRLLLAEALATLAGAFGGMGQPQQAARLLGASESALERLGAFHQPNDKREIDDIITDVHAKLNEANFQAAWAERLELRLEQVVAQALDE
jgi:hypothetical protein